MKIYFFILLSIAIIPHDSATPNKDAQYLGEKVLFIGNSYTYENEGVSQHLRNLVAGTKGDPKKYAQGVTRGRYHLMTHWKDPLTQLIFKSNKWDKIVLQEYGSGPLKKNTEFEKYVKKWAHQLKKVNPDGKLYLFSTWNYRSSPGMEDRLYEKYKEISNGVGANVVPVGFLWKDIRSKIDLYDVDGTHPNRKGTFVTACLFYEQLFNLDVTQTSNTDPELSDQDQTLLKKFAHEFNLKWEK